MCKTDSTQPSLSIESNKILYSNQQQLLEFYWEEITQIFAYKRDFVTFDTLYLEIHLAHGERITIHEDMVGFIAFVAQMESHLCSLVTEWQFSILRPAFELNYQQIFPSQM